MGNLNLYITKKKNSQTNHFTPFLLLFLPIFLYPFTINLILIFFYSNNGKHD